MKNATKSDWLVAEVLANQNELFVLWAIRKGLCTSRDSFRQHYDADFHSNDIIDTLEERGFLRDDDSSLELTDLGTLTIKALLKDNPASDVIATVEARLGDRSALAENDQRASVDIDQRSVEEQIAQCAAALREGLDIDTEDYSEDQIREYLLLRLNLLLLSRGGCEEHIDLLAELLARLCPREYQRSLAIAAIQGALREDAAKALNIAKAILKQYIDPHVLGLAADIANTLNRVDEIEEVVRDSRHLDDFKKVLRSFSGGWTQAYLNRIGLGNLSGLLS